MRVNPRGFYYTDRERNGIWAEGIVKSLMDLYSISTAVDFGCGGGEYTKQLIGFGVKTIGYDGCPHTFDMTSGLGFVKDLSEPVDVGQFDLVLSLEVGEHIPVQYESVFINNVVNACRGIICISWSARSEEEVGGHVNPRKNYYIINEFGMRGWDLDISATHKVREGVGDKWVHFKDSLMIFKNDRYVLGE